MNDAAVEYAKNQEWLSDYAKWLEDPMTKTVLTLAALEASPGLGTPRDVNGRVDINAVALQHEQNKGMTKILMFIQTIHKTAVPIESLGDPSYGADGILESDKPEGVE